METMVRVRLSLVSVFLTGVVLGATACTHMPPEGPGWDQDLPLLAPKSGALVAEGELKRTSARPRLGTSTPVSPLRVSPLRPEVQRPYYLPYGEGLEALRKRKYDKAVRLFSEAIRSLETQPPDEVLAEVYFVRGLAYASKREDTQAKIDYERAIALDEGYFERKEYGRLYYRRGLKRIAAEEPAREVIEDFNWAVARGSEEISDDAYADELTRRAIRRVYAGDDAAAAEDFRAAERLRQDLKVESTDLFAEAYDRRGKRKFDRGDLTGAIEDYKRALDIEPNYTLALNHLEEAQADRRRGPQVSVIDVDADGLLREYAEVRITEDNYQDYWVKYRELQRLRRLSKKTATRDKLLELEQSYRENLWITANAAAERALDQERYPDALGHAERSMKVATREEKARSRSLIGRIKRGFARALVDEAMGLPEGEKSRVQELLTRALELDPTNASARRNLVRPNKPLTEEATPQSALTEQHLVILAAAVGGLILLIAGWILKRRKTAPEPEAPKKAAA